MTLSQLNHCPTETFVDTLGWVFECSPWVAARSAAERPFPDVAALHASMSGHVRRASPQEQTNLLRAHPDLGSRARMSDASVEEQSGAGLHQLTPSEFQQLNSLNAAYKEKFGFPFLYAVKGSTKYDILEAMPRRLARTPEEEFAEALEQVFRIAIFRLHDMIESE